MTTYAELVQNIKDFMEDDGTEFSNEIDKFINSIRTSIHWKNQDS